MKGKIVFVTGATSGIGKATALKLAEMGAEVHIHGRNEQLGAEVKKEIDAISGHQRCKFYTANLSSQASIREMAKLIKQDLPVIDVLVNNAGGVFQKFELTEDGIEKTIALNHFAYFLLTQLLLDNIEKSGAGRIVCVSSRSNFRGKIDLESFTQEKSYFIMRAYEQSKLANIFFTQAMAKRLADKPITINCLHPGVVKTNIGMKDTGKLSAFVWNSLSNLFGISVEDGAKTSVYLASSPDVEKISGKYFDLCKPTPPNKVCKNLEIENALWEKTLELCPV